MKKPTRHFLDILSSINFEHYINFIRPSLIDEIKQGNYPAPMSQGLHRIFFRENMIIFSGAYMMEKREFSYEVGFIDHQILISTVELIDGVTDNHITSNCSVDGLNVVVEGIKKSFEQNGSHLIKPMYGSSYFFLAETQGAFGEEHTHVIKNDKIPAYDSAEYDLAGTRDVRVVDNPQAVQVFDKACKKYQRPIYKFSRGLQH